MRDLVLTAVVAALLLLAFRTPAVGAYVYAWLSMMNPHKLTFGFAFSLPFAQVAALVTLLMLVVTKQRRALPRDPVVYVLLAMFGWMTVTTFFAIAPRAVAWDRWLFVFKIQLMVFVTWMLVYEPRQLRILIWVITLSVAFFGIKGGLWTVLTGGGGRVWGPPGGLLEGNNELAVALVMLLPFLYYLQQTEPRKWIKRMLVVFMVLCAFSVLGSQSRGALLAIVVCAFFLGLKSKYPWQTSISLMLLMVLAFLFMPDSWLNRMETIGTYQQDTSAMSRIWTWKTLLAAAVDRPLVGAGFRADSLEVFGRYAPTEPPYDIFIGQFYVAHSIYFQMLGEHGFPGLGLFLLLGLVTWVRAGRIARQCTSQAELALWMPTLMRMVQVSIIGFAAGGAFLSVAYLDLLYYLIGYVVICSGILQRKAAEPVIAAGLVPVAAGERRKVQRPT